jgi:hypothetical protein
MIDGRGLMERMVAVVVLPCYRSTSQCGRSAVAVQRRADWDGLMRRERFGVSDTVVDRLVSLPFRGLAVGSERSWERRGEEVGFFENRTREHHFVP